MNGRKQHLGVTPCIFSDSSMHQVAVEFAIALVLQVLGLILAVAFLICCALLINLIGKSMSWFTSTWLLFGIYFCPFIAIMAMPMYIYVSWKENVRNESTKVKQKLN